jgi:hypothetical protein
LIERRSILGIKEPSVFAGHHRLSRVAEMFGKEQGQSGMCRLNDGERIAIEDGGKHEEVRRGIKRGHLLVGERFKDLDTIGEAALENDPVQFCSKRTRADDEKEPVRELLRRERAEELDKALFP